MARAPGCIDRVKREALLQAAIDLLAEAGPGASLDDIAMRAGVSRQTLYNHYQSKSGMLAAVNSECINKLAFPAMPSGPDNASDRLTSYGEVLLRQVLRPDQAKLLRALVLVSGSGADDDLVQNILSGRGAKESLARFFRSLAEQGRFRILDPELAAEMFLGLLVAPAQLRAIAGNSNVICEGAVLAMSKSCAQLFLNAHAA